MSEVVVCEYKKSLDTIRTGILSLKAAGADGFEGLLRIALTDFTGIPFRLAASGLQGGMDGDAVMPGDPVCFEAKRYSGEIHRNEVLTKIVDLARSKNIADRLWILGATTEVSSQLATAIKENGDQHAVSTLILDWTATPLPLLAIVVVSASDTAIEFIVKNHHEKTNQKKLTEDELKTAFSSISHHPEFEILLHRLKSNLNVSKLALKRAVDLNVEWREHTFGSTRLARERLGQGLAVLEQTSPSMRNELRRRIAGEVEVRKEVILLGDEGLGKSWLSAQLCSNAEGLALFISAEQFDGVSVDNLDDFLIQHLIKQTGEVDDDALKLRWKHRLQAWRSSPPLASLLIVVDGLNQRQSLRWDRLLNGIQSRLSEIKGRMIVTVRPQFWRKIVVHGIAFQPTIIEVPEWSSTERDRLLKHYGVSLDWLDQQTLQTLHNPRLLSIAVATLPNHEAIAWKGLTTDRLLMEHLRASQRENYEDETFVILTKRLSEHATEVLKRVQESSNEPPQNFQADSSAVIETRFFRPLPGPGGQYELREEGLTLALGFTLVDQLWQTLLAKQEPSMRVIQLVEPISAMDRTADVIFASLLICALDDIRFDTEIFSVLLDAFANIQNVDDRRFEEFIEIVKHQPEALFDVLKDLCLERGRRLNQDWLVHAAFEVARSEAGWKAAETAIHQWLHCYNMDPIAQTNRYHKQGDSEYEKQLGKKQLEIKETFSSLSIFEKKLLERMTDVSSGIDEIFTLALRLLAGHSLVSFAESFISMGLAFSLDRNIHSARKAFQQLTTFNRIERVATRVAFLRSIEPLRTKNTSRGGQWTVVRMLYATGEIADAAVAYLLAEELQKDCYHFDFSLPGSWRQVEVANPDATNPLDMDGGIQQFKSLDPEKILQTMSWGSEDHTFNEFLPVACRFEPTIAIEKTRDILTGLYTRTAFPLRQLILNFECHIPLVDPDLANKFIHRILESDVFETLPEKEQSICRMFSLYYIAAQIPANEQLRCLTSKATGADYLLSIVPSLKPQPTEEIVTALQDALEKNNEDTAYLILAAARYGHTLINDELEEVILYCSCSKSSKLRAISFELATHRDLHSVRQAHICSSWNATSVDEKTFESWFGSMLLVEACVRDEVSIEEFLDRISQNTWFVAADKLGIIFTKLLADWFVSRLRGGVEAISDIQPPLAELKLSRTEPAPFIFLSIEETDLEGERFPKQKSLKEFLEIDDNFDERQNRLNTVVKIFFEGLKGSDARFLVQEITIDNLKKFTAKVPMLLDELVEILDQAEDAQFVWLKNLAFAVANLISAQDPVHAVALLERACSAKGFVTLELEDNLTLEHQAIWGCYASEPVKTLWRQRLLTSENDVILAREVLAAERFGADDFIKSIILQFMSCKDSLDTAYAISIAGYSAQSDQLVDILSKHINDKGFCAQAAKHALLEHKKAHWARKWLESMWSAPTPEEFWLCLMIAKTCMDARVNVKMPDNSRWAQYVPVFHKAKKAAMKERDKEREKLLLGQAKPDPIFVTST
ncbi:hypothetical protein [Aeromonas encheleia]|uniref:NACHT domain-containing protein n=1 Tax=Aeromonas encheleia TaxID=73010 RepID=A0AAE9MDK1_9GAMM|nr:hypothetical protein [Aeromonas encheleia]USV55892.1 hypothetical protein NHF51_10960 [Aeromonas encheleia]